MQLTISEPTSQKEAILAHLQAGQTLTSLQALRYFQCLSLAQRINELRNAGHQISSRMVKTTTGKRVAEYSLIKISQAMPVNQALSGSGLG